MFTLVVLFLRVPSPLPSPVGGTQLIYNKTTLLLSLETLISAVRYLEKKADLTAFGIKESINDSEKKGRRQRS